jgi:cell wall-associated NlpC family hydrolase
MRDLGAPPDWIGAYMGIPFLEGGRTRQGADCYGLARLVLAERFGIVLPIDPAGARLRGMDRAAKDGLAGRIVAARGAWCDVPRGAVKPGHGILLRVEGRPFHVGLVVNDRAFLHTEPHAGAQIEGWDTPRWADRVLGFYEYRGSAP